MLTFLLAGLRWRHDLSIVPAIERRWWLSYLLL